MMPSRKASLLQEFTGTLDDVNSALAITGRYRPPSAIVRTLVHDGLRMLDDFTREHRGYVGKVMDYVCGELRDLLYEVFEEGEDFGVKEASTVWTYRYLLKRIAEFAEEYGIDVVYVDEAYTSSRCPLHGDGCGVRVAKGLFKYTKLNKVFNADIVATHNILMTQTIPSPGGVG
jgi:transposase